MLPLRSKHSLPKQPLAKLKFCRSCQKSKVLLKVNVSGKDLLANTPEKLFHMKAGCHSIVATIRDVILAQSHFASPLLFSVPLLTCLECFSSLG